MFLTIRMKNKLIVAWAMFAIFALALVWLPRTALAQGAPEAEWDRTFGGPSADYGSSVRQTSDGGYIIAGATESSGWRV